MAKVSLRTPHRRPEPEIKKPSRGQRKRAIKKDRIVTKKVLLEKVVKMKKLRTQGEAFGDLAALDDELGSIQAVNDKINVHGSTKRPKRTEKRRQAELEVQRIRNQKIFNLDAFNENPFKVVQEHLRNSRK
jgi:hypothetical protein